jgi:hypothetical protein
MSFPHRDQFANCSEQTQPLTRRHSAAPSPKGRGKHRWVQTLSSRERVAAEQPGEGLGWRCAL